MRSIRKAPGYAALMQIKWRQASMVEVSFFFLLMIGLVLLSILPAASTLRLPAVFAVEAFESSAGTVYYISPEGNDHNPGTLTAPWKTLKKVSSAVKPGDTVLFLPGTYKGTLNPTTGGTPTAPIRFISAERRQARLIGDGSGTFAIRLSNVEHIYIEGFHIESYWEQPVFSRGQMGTRVMRDGYWILIEKASHIQIVDTLMENALGTTTYFPLHITDSRHIQIKDSDIRRISPSLKQTESIPSDVVRVINSSHILFEGNALGRGLHTIIAFHPDAANSYITMRGNVFDAQWSRNFEFFGVDHVLFENNLITGSYKGSWGGSNSKFAVNHGIFRYNQVSRNPGGPIHLFPFREVKISGIHFYHNVFDHNCDYGIQISDRGGVRDIVFSNNIFYCNDLGCADQGPLVVNSGGAASLAPEVVTLHNNVIWNGRGPVTDAGRPLTYTLSAGRGRVIQVADASCFYDGFGIQGEQGDLISVAGEKARLLVVDLAGNILHIDRELCWQNGDPVHVAYHGSGPDIGLYEHGFSGRPTLQILFSSVQVEPNEPVKLLAMIRGEKWLTGPLTYQWHLGDGTLVTTTAPDVTAANAEVNHVYREPGRYPIRARVIDAKGQSLLAVGLIEVTDPETRHILFRSTFDADDTTWWQSWIMHRPEPSFWERRVDAAGAGHLYVGVPDEYWAAAMPALIYPAFWYIDQYPMIKLRYKLAPGTPVALYLIAFSNRRVIVAAAPHHRDAGIPQVSEKQTLVDDGEWHELVVDARSVREVWGKVDMLEGMIFRTGDRWPFAKEQYYALDEVIIARQ